MTRSPRAQLFGIVMALGLPLSVLAAAATPARAVTPAPSPGVDWAGCDLANANLVTADLAGAQLEKANLTSAGMQNADLAGANLADATMSHVSADGNLSNADLTSANLLGAFMVGANLESANLDGASAVAANFGSADLRHADLQDADLQAAGMDGTDLFGANFQGATTDSILWLDAICPNGASANYYTAGCFSSVAVTTPSATPEVTAGTLGKNGWYTSGVTVTWYWIDANSLVPASCPGSTTTKRQGAAVVMSASCTDTATHVGNSSVTVKIDTTPPVVKLTGFRNGAVYDMGTSLLPMCVTTDAPSGVGLNAVTTISAGRPDGTGVTTVTCTGAEDNAGNRGPSLTGHYTVVYLFGGFRSPKVNARLNPSARKITVTFRLANGNGVTIPASTEAALAAHHQVRATLRGPGIKPVVASCSWNAKAKYLECAIATPRHVRTGRPHRYSVTATENLGSGFVTVPADAASENPEPVYFG